MNRYCECLECDTVYQSEDATKKGVRAELTFTVCSDVCQELYDQRVKETEALFKALELDKQSEISKGTDVSDILKGFIKHNVSSK